ncbi:hypothetical protein SUGI_0357030 [Cryptomeria japonica]|nr:hypothetical protein SUGI_0357030 [Cryptomeria japonica]
MIICASSFGGSANYVKVFYNDIGDVWNDVWRPDRDGHVGYHFVGHAIDMEYHLMEEEFIENLVADTVACQHLDLSADLVCIHRSDKKNLFLEDRSEEERIPQGSLYMLSHKDKEIMTALDGARSQPSEVEIAQEVVAMSITNINKSKIDVTQAMLVPQVFSGSPGVRDGLESGDVVLGVNDHLFTLRELVVAISTMVDIIKKNPGKLFIKGDTGCLVRQEWTAKVFIVKLMRCQNIQEEMVQLH